MLRRATARLATARLAAARLANPLLAVVCGLGFRAGAARGCPLIPAVFESRDLPSAETFRLRAEALPAAIGGDAVRLLLGLVLLFAAGFAFWISPAYEQLYRRLFGSTDDY